MRVFFCLFLLLCFSCSDNESDSSDSCVSVIFDESKFNSSQNFGVDLIELDIEDYCLKVKLGVSGCDDDHTIELVSNGAVAPSDPTMVYFDFYDNDPQLCEAYFTLDREFDMTPIRARYNEDIIVAFRNNSGFIKIEN